MASSVAASIFLCVFFISYITASTDFYDKKTIEGMLLKMLWDKVYAGYDVKTKEHAMKNLRKSGDYDKLISHLLKTKKDKVKRIMELFGDIMIEYMR